MHIAYEITPNTPTAVTHTSFPPYSHWDSPLPPFATVWLGKENFRSSGPLKIKVRNLPTCYSFLRDESCSCVSLRVLSSPGHMQRPHFTHLLPSSPFLCESICIFCFFLRAKPRIHFSLPPRLFFWCCCLLLAFFFGLGGFGGGGPGNL